MEDSSAFFTKPEIPAAESLASLKLIHSSERGFCDVFRIDRGGRFRALKCLKPEHRGDALYENLLRKEFEIGYSLDHPNICEYYAFTQIEGLGNCIEMEWVDGRSLERIITETHPSKEVTDHILDGLCDALSYLHSRQTLHRDIKPSNVLVTYKGDNVRLIDFGLSDSDRFSILKTPAGTVDYTAPEVLNGGSADVRSDIYSLGVLMFRLSRRYHRIARKCCEARPAARYSSAAEVKKAIHSNMPLYSGIFFIVLIAVMVLFPYFSRRGKESAAPVVPPVDTLAVLSASQDTMPQPVTVSPVPPAAPKPRSAAGKEKASKDNPAETAVIDELFRQATEMFE